MLTISGPEILVIIAAVMIPLFIIVYLFARTAPSDKD